MNKKYIEAIHCLRGFAALIVVLFHFVCNTFDYVQSESIITVFNYGSQGVQMFFVISGIVIPLYMIKSGYTYSSWHKFMIRRFIRLEPPYLFAIGMVILYWSVRKFIPSSATEDLMISNRDLLLHIGYMVPFVDGAKWAMGAFWTLSIELQYYILLSLMLPFALKAIGSRVLFYTFFLLLPFISDRNDLFLHHSPMFMLGIAYAFWLLKKVSGREFALVYVATVVVILIKLPFSNLITGLVTIGIVHYLPNIKPRIWIFLGTISYSLYLTHQIIGSPIIKFLSHRFRADYQKPLVILFAIAVSVLVAWVVYRLIERPAHRVSRKFDEKTSIRTAPSFQQ